MSLKIELQTRILDHPEIELRKSRFSGEEAFYVGKREIAHFHGVRELDLRLTRPAIRKLGLLKSDDKRLHSRSASSDWLEVRFTKEADLDFVIELVEIAVKANR